MTVSVCKCPKCAEGVYIWFIEKNHKCPWCEVPLKMSLNGTALLEDECTVTDAHSRSRRKTPTE